MALDGFLLVGETVVVIVHAYVLTENRFTADMDLLDGMHRTIVVKEDMVSDGDGAAHLGGQLQSFTEVQ